MQVDTFESRDANIHALYPDETTLFYRYRGLILLRVMLYAAQVRISYVSSMYLAYIITDSIHTYIHTYILSIQSESRDKATTSSYQQPTTASHHGMWYGEDAWVSSFAFLVAFRVCFTFSRHRCSCCFFAVDVGAVLK
jgi:hypothetical protein